MSDVPPSHPVLPARPLRLAASFVRGAYTGAAICVILATAALVGVPSQFASSWVRDLQSAKWGSAAALAVACAGVGIFLLYEATQVLRRLAAARLAAVASDEVELELARIRRDAQYGRGGGMVWYDYRVSTPSGMKEREIGYRAKRGHTPLFADAGQTRIVALQSARAPNRPVVVRSDLFPFEASEEQKRAVAKALEQRAESASGEQQPATGWEKAR